MFEPYNNRHPHIERAMEFNDWYHSDYFNLIGRSQGYHGWSDPVPNVTALNEAQTRAAQNAGFSTSPRSVQGKYIPLPFGSIGVSSPPFTNNTSFFLPNLSRLTEPGFFYSGPSHDVISPIPLYSANSAACDMSSNSRLSRAQQESAERILSWEGEWNLPTSQQSQTPISITPLAGFDSNGAGRHDINTMMHNSEAQIIPPPRCDSVLDGQCNTSLDDIAATLNSSFVWGDMDQLVPMSDAFSSTDVSSYPSMPFSRNNGISLPTGPTIALQPKAYENDAIDIDAMLGFRTNLQMSHLRDHDWTTGFPDQSLQEVHNVEQLYGGGEQDTQQCIENALEDAPCPTQRLGHGRSWNAITSSDSAMRYEAGLLPTKRKESSSSFVYSPPNKYRRVVLTTDSEDQNPHTGATGSCLSPTRNSARPTNCSNLVRIKLTHKLMREPRVLVDANGDQYTIGEVLARRLIKNGMAEQYEYSCRYQTDHSSFSEWVPATDLDWNQRDEFDKRTFDSDFDGKRILDHVFIDSDADRATADSNETDFTRNETLSTDTPNNDPQPTPSTSPGSPLFTFSAPEPTPKNGTSSSGGMKSKQQRTKRKREAKEKALFSSKGSFTDNEKEIVAECYERFRSDQAIYSSELNDLIKIDLTKKGPRDGRAQAFWSLVFAKLPLRDHVSIRKHCRRRFVNAAKRGAGWTVDEQAKLIELVKEHTKKEEDGTEHISWSPVAVKLDRRREDVRDYYRDYAQYGDKLRRCAWTAEEGTHLASVVRNNIQAQRDDQIKKGIPAHIVDDAQIEAKINWESIADLLGGTRNRLQCHQHWDSLKNRRPKKTAAEKKKSPRKASLKAEKPILSDSTVASSPTSSDDNALIKAIQNELQNTVYEQDLPFSASYHTFGFPT